MRDLRFVKNFSKFKIPLLATKTGYRQLSSNVFSYENRNILQLKDRGLVVGIFPDRLDNFNGLMASDVQGCYCGFDPTAPSLHVGNLIALITLIHCQRRGHAPVALIGSATALIGDPSGRKTERDVLRNEEITNNSIKIQENIQRVFDNHENFIWKKRNKDAPLPKLQVLNNIDWFQNINIIKFMSVFARHLRIGDLLSRKQIETRLNSSEGLNYTEFSYQVFQAYDWLYLFENHNCSIQIGGNDQTGNIKTGHELISKMKSQQARKVFGLTLPIITSESGEKFGKTAGNAIWLDGAMCSPYHFYQFFYNTSDQMVDTYLKLFTFLPLTEIDDLMREHKSAPHKFKAQRKLASELTTLVHGESGLESALKCTQAFFYGNRETLSVLTENEIDTIFKDATKYDLPMEPGMTVIELAMKLRHFKTLEEAERVIRSGGLKLNSVTIPNPAEALIFGQHILMNNITIIRAGKKKYFLVKWLA